MVGATVLPTFFNTTPSPRGDSFIELRRVGIAVLIVQHFFLGRLGIILHSLGKTSMHSFIPKLGFLDVKTTLLGASDFLPI